MTDASGQPNIEETVELVHTNDSTDEAHLRLLVGSKADYYLAQWHEILRGRSCHCGFNKAAFFLAALWLPYRKMYRVAFALWLVIALETVISNFVFVEVLGHDDAPSWYDRLITLLVALVCGNFGNRWYYWHCRRKLGSARERGCFEHEGLAEALQGQGGTSLLASIAVTILGIGMTVGIVFTYFFAIEIIKGV